MDNIDKKILGLLQEDAELSVSDIADKVGLSTTPCWRRIQNMEKNGVIKGRVAILDADKLNVGVTVFVAIKTSQHNPDWLEQFAEGLDKIDEVVEVYRMSGDVDYMLKVQVPDIAAYDQVYKRLISIADMFDVSSHFSMEQIKYTTKLPLDYIK